MVKLQPGQSLYEALGVERTAEASEIRKAYLKLAVQLHPDKNPDNAEAKEKFQTLQKIYSVLSDPEKRKVYNRTGSLEDTEQLSGEQFDNLYNFYRTMYAAVTEQDIDDFGATFKGGAEERADVLRHYEEFEGNMPRVFDWVMLSDPEEDSHRYMDLINSAIETGEVQRYKKYTTWAAGVAKKKRPAPVVAGATNTKSKSKKGGGASKKGESSEQALVAMMQKRRQGAFEGMLSSLASKYGVDDDDFPPEPTDEEFEAARQRIAAAKSSGSAGKKRQGSNGGASGSKKQQKNKK